MTIRSCRSLAFATCAMSILLCARADAQTLVDEWLSVRTGPAAVLLDPSSSSIVVGTVAVGTRVQALRLEGGWYLVRVPKAADELAPVSGWIPAAMLSRVKVDMVPVGTSGRIEPQAPVVGAAAPSVQGSASPGLLNDLRSQRDKVDVAIQALEGVADAQTLRVRRDKLDRAIRATEDLGASDAFVVSETPSVPRAAVGETTPRTADVRTPEQAPNPVLSYRTGVERKGFLIGLSVGGGGSKCEGCSLRHAGAGTFQIGGMLTDKLGLMYDGAANSNVSDGYQTISSVGTAAVQYWVGTRSWIKGGAGFGTLVEDCCDIATGLAVMGGGGVELLQKRKFVLDLQGRVTRTQFDFGNIHMFLVSLGVNWY